MDGTVVLGRQGRLVIPAEVRAALGLSAGDHLHLHLHLVGGRLVLQRLQEAAVELRALGSTGLDVSIPGGRAAPRTPRRRSDRMSVLDASAVLALVQDEPGADTVEAARPTARGPSSISRSESA